MKYFLFIVLILVANSGQAQTNKPIANCPWEDSVLYIVDSLPLNAIEGANVMGWLKPDEIISIEIVRSTISIERYGLRGKNGAILLFTKHKKFVSAISNACFFRFD